MDNETGFICKAKSQFVEIRERKFHFLSWGDADKSPIVMLHGFMDHAHTFDWIANILMEKYHLIAWDARGFGQTEWVHPSGYYHFPEYLLDLQLFLEAINIENPILLGHSMGGIIASFYSGAFPEKVKAVINIEGWMIPNSPFSSAPERVRLWIDGVKNPGSFKPLNSLFEAIQRLQKTDPQLSYEIASHMAEMGTFEKNGKIYWFHDPLHRTRSPQPAYSEQMQAFWNNITCPVLLLKGENTPSENPQFAENIKAFKTAKYEEIPESGHNLHLHQPEITAKKIISFLGSIT